MKAIKNKQSDYSQFDIGLCSVDQLNSVFVWDELGLFDITLSPYFVKVKQNNTIYI